MDRSHLRRLSVQRDREWTEEERQELDDLMNYDSDAASSGEEYQCDPDDSDASIYDEGDEDTAIEDIELEELNRSINEDEPDVLDDDVGEVDAVAANSGQKYTGQGKGDKTAWWSNATESEKMRTDLLKRERDVSSARSTLHFAEKKDAFMHFFPMSIVEQIVLETNRKAKRAYEANLHTDTQPKNIRKWTNVTTDEMYAYIGILIYAGAEKSNTVHIKDLFAQSYIPFYRAVMSQYRFEQLSRFLRFDDSRTRLDRLRADKLAPIRQIWTSFQGNLATAFVPSLNLCIDEQLLVCRNRCSFRQYIPSKPGKYGIKIFWAVDSKTNLPVSAEIYVGTQPTDARSTGVSYDLVMRLCKDYLHIGTNITMDNFFTSYKLAIDLAKKDTTIVGTVRLNKRELPKSFSSIEKAKKRGVNTAVFCFSGPCELVSYTTKNSKNVCLLSTAHATEQLNDRTKKPTVIHDYNAHKGGVDTFDKMLRAYTCKRKNLRWPVLLFFNMIDVGCFAAFRTFELCHQNWKGNPQDKRKLFLKELAFDLARNNMQKRSTVPKLRSTIKIAMNLIGFTVEKTHPKSMPKKQVKIYTSYIYIYFKPKSFLFTTLSLPLYFAFSQPGNKTDATYVKPAKEQKTTKQQPYATYV